MMYITVPKIFAYKGRLIWRQSPREIVGPYRYKMFVVNGRYFYIRRYLDMNNAAVLAALLAATDGEEYKRYPSGNGYAFRVDAPKKPLDLFSVTLFHLDELQDNTVEPALRHAFTSYKQKNARLFCMFSDESFLYFARGIFDDWCVFFSKPNVDKDSVPLDREYFSDLKTLGNKCGNDRVYQDFVKIYDMTDGTVKQSVLDEIHRIAYAYEQEDAGGMLHIEQMFTILYAAMIAEIHKDHAPLGKRIKRHGVYKVLMENYDPNDAADEDKKRGWREISAECEKKGF